VALFSKNCFELFFASWVKDRLELAMGCEPKEVGEITNFLWLDAVVSCEVLVQAVMMLTSKSGNSIRKSWVLKDI